MDWAFMVTVGCCCPKNPCYVLLYFLSIELFDLCDFKTWNVKEQCSFREVGYTKASSKATPKGFTNLLGTKESLRPPRQLPSLLAHR